MVEMAVLSKLDAKGHNSSVPASEAEYCPMCSKYIAKSSASGGRSDLISWKAWRTISGGTKASAVNMRTFKLKSRSSTYFVRSPSSEILHQLACPKWKKQHSSPSPGNKDLMELYAAVSKSDLNVCFTLIVLLLVVLLFVDLFNVASIFCLVY